MASKKLTKAEMKKLVGGGLRSLGTKVIRPDWKPGSFDVHETPIVQLDNPRKM
ncbi:MAG: hypothetical protein AB1486_29565 [Planctomycetota bacterium]